MGFFSLAIEEMSSLETSNAVEAFACQFVSGRYHIREENLIDVNILDPLEHIRVFVILSTNSISSSLDIVVFAFLPLPFAFLVDFSGEENKWSIGSRPFSSRIPVSSTVRPVFLNSSVATHSVL